MLASHLNLTSSYYYNSAGVTVAVSCCILVLLFALQHIGTHRVSFLFAPIILAWLLCNSTIGLYNLFNHNLVILRAVSPYYMYNYFKVSGKDGWISLGGVLLCITGRYVDCTNLSLFAANSCYHNFTATQEATKFLRWGVN